MSFRKIAEIFTPDDLVWLHVVYDYQSKKVSIQGRDNARIEICDGNANQLDEMIKLLSHLRSTFYPKGEDE